MEPVRQPEDRINYAVNSRLKHYILHDYLSAWLPIMSSFADTLAYVDCFAGPGSCNFRGTPSDGSPLVALRTINRFLRESPPTVHRPGKIDVTFVEAQSEKHRQLEVAIKELDAAERLDSRISYSVRREDARSVLPDLLDRIPPKAPAFYFLDPNYQLPDMDVMRQLLSRQKTEVFANFMYYGIVINMANPLDRDNMIALFGDGQYQSTDFGDGHNPYCWDRVINFYAARTGARYYIPFRVCFGPDEPAPLRGRLKYVLVHLSNHFKAFDVMLAVMDKNSEPGNSLQISMNQPTLFPRLDNDDLTRKVRDKYQNSGVKVSFNDLRQENWQLYASEKRWRSCLNVLKNEGTAQFHPVTSTTEKGIKGKDIVEFLRR